MRLRASLHALLSAAILLSGAAGFVAACTDESTTSTPSADGGRDGRSGDDDASEGEDDGATPDQDGGGTDAKKPGKDANGPGEAGDPCIFNRDCQSALRCECDGSPDCFCAVGVRGTGQNGVTVCNSGNDCTSSVCAEGTDGNSYCTDECDTDDDCEAKLPLCKDISFVGRICTRMPPP